MKKSITKLIFVRHGESEKNILNIKSRAVDKHPLTEKGIRGTGEVAAKIDDKIDLIICSPVLRCRQTAEILNKKFKKKIIYDELISEYDSGVWDEISWGELIKLESYQDYCQIKKDHKKRFYWRAGETGETRAEIVARIGEFIKKVRKGYKGKTILVVSHGGINAAINKVLNNISFEDYFKQEDMDYKSIYTLEL